VKFKGNSHILFELATFLDPAKQSQTGHIKISYNSKINLTRENPSRMIKVANLYNG